MPAEYSYQKSKIAIREGFATSAILAQIDLALENCFNILVVGNGKERTAVSDAIKELAGQYGSIRELKKGDALEQILNPGEKQAFFSMDLDTLDVDATKQYVAKIKGAAAENKNVSLIMETDMHCAYDAVQNLRRRGLSNEELANAHVIYVVNHHHEPEILNFFGISSEGDVLLARCDITYTQEGEFDNGGKLILKSKNDIEEFMQNLTQYAQKVKVLNMPPHSQNFILEAIKHYKNFDDTQLRAEILKRIAKFEHVPDDGAVADFFAQVESSS